jgi:hypothetical protein
MTSRANTRAAAVATTVASIAIAVFAPSAIASIQAAIDCVPACEVSAGTTVTFVSSSTSSPPIREYEWDLDGDGLYGMEDTPAEPFGGSATGAQRHFPDPGSFQVGLRVTNGDAEESTATRTVTVTPAPPPSEPEPPANDHDSSIVGTPGNDVLRGTSGNDSIYGLGGNDRLKGRGGADILIGGPGSDTMYGGSGGDKLIAGHGRDKGGGQGGKDKFYDVDSQGDRFAGGAGKDSLFTPRKIQKKKPGIAEKVVFVGDKTIVGVEIICGIGGCGDAFLFLANPNGNSFWGIDPPGAVEYIGGAGPAWAPNGVEIAFAAPDGSIKTVNWDGSGMQDLGVPGSSPAWSPDGTRIAFEREGQIWLMKKDGSNAVQLTGAPNVSHANVDPAWTPDGTRIWFSRRDVDDPVSEGDYELWSMNADGTGKARATDNTVHDIHPAWGPGGQLAWASVFDGCGRMFCSSDALEGAILQTQQGNTPHTSLIGGHSPAFSGSGQQLVFSRSDMGLECECLHRIDLAGTGLIEFPGFFAFDPSWRW